MIDIDALDDFTRSYIECALWCDESTNEYNHDNPEGDCISPHNSENWDIENLSNEALDRMQADCKSFQYSFGYMWKDDAQAGHDFWLTRNGHGAGFWDRDESVYGVFADNLTEHSQSFPEVYMYEGDDGKIYIG